jgi:hypothetical protein
MTHRASKRARHDAELCMALGERDVELLYLRRQLDQELAQKQLLQQRTDDLVATNTELREVHAALGVKVDDLSTQLATCQQQFETCDFDFNFLQLTPLPIQYTPVTKRHAALAPDKCQEKSVNGLDAHNRVVAKICIYYVSWPRCKVLTRSCF